MSGLSESAKKVARSYYQRVVRGKRERRFKDAASRVSKAVFPDSRKRQELVNFLISQFAAFNSPVWFNLGVKKNPQCSACFILKVDDSLAGLLDLMKVEASLFRFGSGAGANFSPIRSIVEKTSSGGIPGGLMRFLKAFDATAGAINSGDTARRSAKMVCVDADHPEIEEFIEWKSKEEKKARILINAGFSGGMSGEVFLGLSGQNSNNSVRLSDEFMNAVRKNSNWGLRRRADRKILRQISARELYEKICYCAWECADPGVQFDTTINAWNTCANEEKIEASNPCSEFMFLNNTSCNLASLNLIKFLGRDFRFQWDRFRDAVECFIEAQDRIVDIAGYPTAEIARKTRKFRPLGLGFANLGGLLMSLGIPYDSDEGRDLASKITAFMSGVAYRKSAELAEKFGAYGGFKKNKSSHLGVMEKHVSYLGAEQGSKEWSAALSLGKRKGFRNSQVTLIAPTGTIGLLMDCDSLGIEPAYSLFSKKTLAEGGFFRKSLQSVELGLVRLGYGSEGLEKILQHLRKTGEVQGAPGFNEKHAAVFDCAIGKSRFVSAEGHLRMMAAVQPFLSGAISKTVNLPQDSKVGEIREIYTRAWELGLKSISVYRDGSKIVQPLQAECGVCSVG